MSTITKRIRELEDEVDTGNKLLEERNRILKALPCPVHGDCVPYVLERIAAMERVVKVMREEHDPDCSALAALDSQEAHHD